jgi:hypothetical protein
MSSRAVTAADTVMNPSVERGIDVDEVEAALFVR